MKRGGRNHPCSAKEQAGDESEWSKSSLQRRNCKLGMNLVGRNHPLQRKRVSQGCNCEVVEIILAEEKSKLGMKLSGRNHPCSAEKQAGDETGRKKSSLR